MTFKTRTLYQSPVRANSKKRQKKQSTEIKQQQNSAMNYIFPNALNSCARFSQEFTKSVQNLLCNYAIMATVNRCECEMLDAELRFEQTKLQNVLDILLALCEI